MERPTTAALRPVHALVAVLGALLLAVTACGQQSGGSAGGTSSSPSAKADPTTTQPWLVRLDSYLGEDGEAIRSTYVTVVPATGKASVATLPEVPVAEARGSNGQVALVDAGHRWALADVRPTAADRAAGRVVVHDLSDRGRATTLDVRRGSGSADLRADWASFDPARPGLLRVVSGSSVWTVRVPDGTTTREGSLPTRDGWIYSGGFDRRTGEPYIEDIASFDTLPAGNGEDDTTPITRGDGTVLDPNGEKPYGDRPAPGCETSAGFVAADGTAWAFCQAATKIEVKTLPKGATTWKALGTTDAVIDDQMTPVFVLPPAADG